MSSFVPSQHRKAARPSRPSTPFLKASYVVRDCPYAPDSAVPCSWTSFDSGSPQPAGREGPNCLCVYGLSSYLQLLRFSP
jgi:hypothetical protein